MSIEKLTPAPVKNRIIETDPLWYKDAIIYELHVKAFCDGNNDGIGDFPGLISKLEYLRDLGVTCLWLLPFYPSPLRDDGYDISDYLGVHPSYGTMKDFRAFVRKAHDLGLRVITELVVNHTSDQHPWFKAARAAPPGSKERNFYVWSDTDQKYSDARIIFTDSEKSNWTWDPVAKVYYWHRFFHHQPDLNFDNPAVRRAIIKVMHYWLDIGVDGLRLDAVPYLVERDGTNCENLPETHAILREMRSRLDERYGDRMFLAEANQWPADVLPYFGEGKECHMAFHFPLMPRLFMALRQEDRHPITEIIRQTPEIPDTCQWALFLRNHDELTLEMVTDEDRDYMYYEYASDPMMRLNVGIKRRLAPLLEGGRRRLELLNSFLFSFPGTPIIYYGDEIGMGDNIFLGDRNSVRTPMQWTGDRNAGFSRADPARLYSPPVMDPVYGYQAINVEAQERDSSSLLNWMKRMISLRRTLKVFSRGSMEIVFPQNRKLIAYVRRYEDEIVLAVANLSRFVQPADLDLSAFKGLTPVEMIGRVEFPTIGERPYFLTLSPHSFMWFHLRKHTASAMLLQRKPFDELFSITIEKGGAFMDIFKGNAKRRLETELFPRYIQQQRWFAGKSRKLVAVRITDWGEIGGIDSPAFIVVVDAEFTLGHPETYLIPLAVATGAVAEQVANELPGSVVARLSGQPEPTLLYDAYWNEAVCTAFFNFISDFSEIKLQRGTVKAEATSAFKTIFRNFDVLPFKPKVSPGDQSNTSILYGERFILKMFRRIQEGINPEYEIGLFLTENAGFKFVPRMAGGLVYDRPGEMKATFGVINEYLENQGGGWAHAQSALGQFFEQVHIRGDEGIPQEISRATVLGISAMEVSPLAMEVIGPYLNAASMLGKRTAELHLTLARNTEDPAFAPEALTASDLSVLSIGMKELAQKALKALETNLDKIPEDVRDQAHGLLSTRSKLLDQLKPPKMNDIPGGKIRCHGDYHLGQLLWVENNFIILDFEGEPSRTIAERRTKQSPIKDVAGILGSYEYAAQSALLHYIQDRPNEFARLSPWANFWRKWVSAMFLHSYLAASKDACFLPADQSHFEALLNMFYLDKTFYELLYELNNRPDWIRIPLGKLSAL